MAEKTRLELQTAKSAARKLKEDAAKERAKAKERRLRAAVDTLLKLPEVGFPVFEFLFHFCGYNRSSLAVDPQTRDVQTLSTECNEAIRSVYLQLRRKASPDLLAKVEAAIEAEQFKIEQELDHSPEQETT